MKPKRSIVRRLFPILLVPCCILAWFHIEGLPGFLRKELSLFLEQKGVYVDAARVRVQLHRGLLCEGVEVFVPQDRVSPTLVAGEALLRLDYLPWLRERRLLGEIQVRNARLKSDLGVWANDLSTRQPIEVSDLAMDLAFANGELELRRFVGQLLAIRLDVQGTWSPRSKRSRSEEASASGDSIDVELFEQLAKGIRYLEQVELDHAARCQIRFHVDLDRGNPLSASAVLSHQGAGTLRGLPLDQVHLEARLSDRDLVLHPCTISAGTNALDLALHYDQPENLLQLNLTNSLPRYYLDHLAPPSLFRMLERIDLRLEGDTLFDLQLGPAPPSAIGTQVQGTFDVVDAFYKDAPVPSMKMSFSLEKGRMHLSEMDGVAGSGTGRGPLTGEVLYDFGNGELLLDLKSGFDPSSVGRILQGTSEAVLRRFEFPGEPPTIHLYATREHRDGGALHLAAELDCGELVYHGTKLDLCEVEIRYRDQVVSVTNLVAVRGGERLVGHSQRDMREGSLLLDLRSSFHPAALARILHADGEQLLAPYRFRGTNELALAGTIDLAEQKNHRLSGRFSASDVAWRWLGMDEVDFSFALTEDQLTVPDLQGRQGEGTLVGSLSLEGLAEPETSVFSTRLQGDDLDLFHLVNIGLDTTNNPYSGRLAFSLDLQGDLRARLEGLDPKDSYEGEGSIRIRDGKLFSLPLLGGLSRILSRVVKGFGYAAQTDFLADFQVADSRISSDNLFLKGKVVSVKGAGYLGFNQSVKADVQVKLLSDGVVSEALQLLTWPITKLIEIRVRGTLAEPDWQPRNLPKELFGK